MLSRKLVEITSWRSNPLACQPEHLDLLRNLPDIPVLPETLLLMELKVRERSVDLSEVSQIVLSDIGAALQIMRLARSEYASSDCRSRRIEDCIAGLALQACLEAMSRRIVAHSGSQSAVVGAWEHARDIAVFCSFLAEYSAENTSPQDAYLVGLFHELGRLPAVLGWDAAITGSRDQNLVGLSLAEAWALPPCVVEYFSDRLSFKTLGKLGEFVEQGHQLAYRLAANYTIESHRSIGMEPPG